MAESYLRNQQMERMNERRARAGMASYVPQEPTQTAGQALADTLGGFALGTTFIPGYGDVAGLAADAAMYANYPEERTLGNYAMTALGALPFVPPASVLRSGKKAADAALDMGQEARMQRAQEMGFDTQTPYYHGTSSDFEEFTPSTVGHLGRGVYITPDPEIAGGYANMRKFMRRQTNNAAPNTMPLYTKKDLNLVNIDGNGVPFLDDNAIQSLIDRSYDGVRQFDNKGKLRQINIFDPANIRSVNAAFDPAKQDSRNLMSGVGAAGILTGSMRQQREDQE